MQALREQTEQAIALISQQPATAVIKQQQIDFSKFPDLRLPGSYSWTVQTLKLDDQKRERTFFADLYLPQTQKPSKKTTLPVIVISHGLGSDRNSFKYLAQRLATYGSASLLFPNIPAAMPSNYNR